MDLTRSGAAPPAPVSRELTPVPALPSTIAEIQQLTSGEALAVASRLAGRADAFAVNENLNRVMRVAVYKQMRETDAHRSHGLTWEDYCARVIGRPRTSVDEEIRWLEGLGSELLSLAFQSGLGRSALRLLHGGQKKDETRLVLQDGEIIVGTQRAPLQDESAANDLLARHIAWLENQVEDSRGAAEEARAQAASAKEDAEQEIEVLTGKLQEKKAAAKLEKARDLRAMDLQRALFILAGELGHLVERVETEYPDRDMVLSAYRVLSPLVSRIADYGRGRARQEITAPEIDMDALDDVLRAQAAIERADAAADEEGDRA